MFASHAPVGTDLSKLTEEDYEQYGMHYIRPYARKWSDEHVQHHRADAEVFLNTNSPFRFAIVRHPW